VALLLVRNGPASKRLAFAAVAVLGGFCVFAGMAMRIVDGTQGSYWNDELVSIYAARGVLAHGVPVLPSGFLYTKSELYSYLLAGALAIYNTAWTARGLSVLLSIATLVVLFLLARRSFGTPVATLTVSLFALTPIEIQWAHEARMYQLLQLCSLAFLYFLIPHLDGRERLRDTIAAIGFLTAMFFSLELSLALVPGTLLVLLWRRRLSWLRNHALVSRNRITLTHSLGQDLVWGLDPGEGLALVVPGGLEALDGGAQVGEAAEDAAA
jgi:4-amino-4-deoxy-L-arabinose transferase-like glycosyltransferase